VRFRTPLLIVVSAVSLACTDKDQFKGSASATSASVITLADSVSSQVDSVIAVVESRLNGLSIDTMSSELQLRLAESLVQAVANVVSEDMVRRLDTAAAGKLNEHVRSRTAKFLTTIERLNERLALEGPAAPTDSGLIAIASSDSAANLTGSRGCSRCCMCLGAHRRCCFGHKPGKGLCLGVWSCPNSPSASCVKYKSCPCAEG
jgi:hypothetical protein